MGSKAGSTIKSKGDGGAALAAAEAPAALSGFDSLKSDVPAAVKAAEEPEQRVLRPPHRRHMPNVEEEAEE